MLFITYFFLVAALWNLLRPPACLFHWRHRLHLRQPPVHFLHRLDIQHDHRLNDHNHQGQLEAGSLQKHRGQHVLKSSSTSTCL